MANTDERHDALRESVELLLVESREHTVRILELLKQRAIDAQNISALARIVEARTSRA
jgi:hypothetical protein